MEVSHMLKILIIWNFMLVMAIMGETSSGTAPPATNETNIGKNQRHHHNHQTEAPETSGWREYKIAVPVTAYKEFVNFTYDDAEKPHFDGFTIRVFEAIKNSTLNNYGVFHYIPYIKLDGTINGTYDSMLQAVSSQDYDGAVGDTTIRYDRSQWVDFTLPYTDTGISMMVSTQVLARKSSGIKVIPLIKGLVYLVFGVCLSTALIFWFVEFRNDKNRPSSHASTTFGSNPFGQRSHHNDDYWRRETLRAIIETRLVVVMFFLVLLFLTSCYAASLTSLLTTQRPKTPMITLDELIRQQANVGILAGSFLHRFLIEKGFSDIHILSYNSEHEMVTMLSKGNSQGGVVAVIEETTYLKLFLSKNCNKGFALVPSFNLPSEGFGFAFRKGFHLLSEVSNGILKLMDEGRLAEIRRQTIGDLETCQNDSDIANVDSNLLDLDTMWILCAGAIGVAILMIILYMVYFGTTCDTIRRRFVYPCYLLPNYQERKN